MGEQLSMDLDLLNHLNLCFQELCLVHCFQQNHWILQYYWPAVSHGNLWPLLCVFFHLHGGAEFAYL